MVFQKNDLFVSIYEDDDEAFEIWNKSWVFRLSVFIDLVKKIIFGKWDTGPCGPCTEIFYDTRSQNERTMLPT